MTSQAIFFSLFKKTPGDTHSIKVCARDLKHSQHLPSCLLSYCEEARRLVVPSTVAGLDGVELASGQISRNRRFIHVSQKREPKLQAGGLVDVHCETGRN